MAHTKNDTVPHLPPSLYHCHHLSLSSTLSHTPCPNRRVCCEGGTPPSSAFRIRMTNKILLARDTGFRLKHVRNYSPQRPHGDERPSKVRRIDPECLRPAVPASAPQQLSPECCPMSLDRSSPPSVQRGASDAQSPACATPVRRLSFGTDDRGEGFSFGSPVVRTDRRKRMLRGSPHSAGSACSASPDTLAAEARRPNRGTAYGTVSALLDHADVRRRRARRCLQLSITTPKSAACGGAPELPPPTPLRCALKGYDFGALRKPRTAAAAGPSLLSAPFQPRHSVAPPSLPAAARLTTAAHAVVAARASAPAAAAPSAAANKPKAAAAVAPAPAHAAQHPKKTAHPAAAAAVVPPPAEATTTMTAAAAAPCVEPSAGGSAKERKSSMHQPHHHHHRPVHRHNHSHPQPAAEVVMGPVWQRRGAVLPPDAVRAPVLTGPQPVAKKHDAAEKMPPPPAAAAPAAPKAAPHARKRPAPVQQDGADTVSERRQARVGRANHFAVYREEQRKAAAASHPNAPHAGTTRRRSASQTVYGTGEVEAAAAGPAPAPVVVAEGKEQRVPFAPLTNMHHTEQQQQQGPRAQSAWGQGVYKNGSDRERAKRVMEMKRIAAERSRQRYSHGTDS